MSGKHPATMTHTEMGPSATAHPPAARQTGGGNGEDPDYLEKQIITYLGNKRSLLNFIGKGISQVCKKAGKRKLRCLDLFAGSGVVSRYMRRYADCIYTNDLETYSRIINECYMTNRTEVDTAHLSRVLEGLRQAVLDHWSPGFITAMYAPGDEQAITKNDRVFYTRRNAIYIDTARREIDKIAPGLRKYFLAPLLYEASVHNNTPGVFKGFYKNKEGRGQFGGSGQNALTRILGNIELQLPVFSRYEVESHILQLDARKAVESIPEVDLAYLDPPYNQHPYGSNYFMLNLIANNKAPESCSRISGIPGDWNRSPYNKRATATAELFHVIEKCPAKFVLISYNSEGFVPYRAFMSFLSKLGKVSPLQISYNTFRGSRNLNNRSIKVTEYLFLLEKNA